MKVGDLVRHLGRPSTGPLGRIERPGVHLVLHISWGPLKFVRIVDTNGKIWHSHIPHLEIISEDR